MSRGHDLQVLAIVGQVDVISFADRVGQTVVEIPAQPADHDPLFDRGSAATGPIVASTSSGEPTQEEVIVDIRMAPSSVHLELTGASDSRPTRVISARLA